MYVCAYDTIWDGMHVRHISLSCITYIVLCSSIGPHIEQESNHLGVAIIGCIVQGH